jgi:hypothetical protein
LNPRLINVSAHFLANAIFNRPIFEIYMRPFRQLMIINFEAITGIRHFGSYFGGGLIYTAFIALTTICLPCWIFASVASVPLVRSICFPALTDQAIEL